MKSAIISAVGILACAAAGMACTAQSPDPPAPSRATEHVNKTSSALGQVGDPCGWEEDCESLCCQDYYGALECRPAESCSGGGGGDEEQEFGDDEDYCNRYFHDLGLC